jgi:hypothetical protein
MKYGGFKEAVILISIKNQEVETPSASAFNKWHPKVTTVLVAEPNKESMFAHPAANSSLQSIRYLEMPSLLFFSEVFPNGKQNFQELQRFQLQFQNQVIAGNGVTLSTGSS